MSWKPPFRLYDPAVKLFRVTISIIKNCGKETDLTIAWLFTCFQEHTRVICAAETGFKPVTKWAENKSRSRPLFSPPHWPPSNRIGSVLTSHRISNYSTFIRSWSRTIRQPSAQTCVWPHSRSLQLRHNDRWMLYRRSCGQNLLTSEVLHERCSFVLVTELKTDPGEAQLSRTVIPLSPVHIMCIQCSSPRDWRGTQQQSSPIFRLFLRSTCQLSTKI
jgi:hypothetical protein